MNWQGKFVAEFKGRFLHPGPGSDKRMEQAIADAMRQAIEAQERQVIKDMHLYPPVMQARLRDALTEAQRPQISRLASLLQARQEQIAETVERERERAEEGLF